MNIMSEHLDDVESRADFWCQIVQDSGAISLRVAIEHVEEVLRTGKCEAGRQLQLGDLRENVLEKLFDLSAERLKEVYESIDKDSDGRILKEDLQEGLHRCELGGLDEAVEKVLSLVSRDDGAFHLAEFESVLTRLKLAQLLGTPKFESQVSAHHLTITDYSSASVKEQSYSLRDYFFGHRNDEFPTRWVHMGQFDLTLFLALTVKYQLHPLSVEDVVDQAPTKVDRYEGHYFGSIEHLEIASAISGHEPVKVRSRHVTLFCAAPPHLDTVITVSQVDRSFKLDWPGEVDNSGSQEDAWVARLRKRLRAVRSRTRERRADFLMYEIIDLCTDDLRVVTRVYSARLNWLEHRLNESMMNCEQSKVEWFNEVGLIRLQLAVVSRRLRGLQRILRRLAEDPDLATTLTGYLQDVADHVSEAFEDAGHLVEKCKSLSEAYDHKEERAQDKTRRVNAAAKILRDERMNKILFMLTVLSTIFTPLTWAAGIYGMNFKDEDGHTTMPELLEPNGYYYFLTFTIVYLLVSFGIGIWFWRSVSRGIRREATFRDRLNSGLPSANGSDYVAMP